MSNKSNYTDSLSPATNIAALSMEAQQEANRLTRSANKIAMVAAIAAIVAAVAAVDAKETIQLFIKTS